MHSFRLRSAPATALAALLLAGLTTATALSQESENWPSFRGPDALSVADDDPRLPSSWSTTENVVWKTPVEGLGWSSPVIWGDLIFVTTVVSEGESQEPRMGLYFPFGSPQPGAPELGFPDPVKGPVQPEANRGVADPIDTSKLLERPRREHKPFDK